MSEIGIFGGAGGGKTNPIKNIQHINAYLATGVSNKAYTLNEFDPDSTIIVVDTAKGSNTNYLRDQALWRNGITNSTSVYIGRYDNDTTAYGTVRVIEFNNVKSIQRVDAYSGYNFPAINAVDMSKSICFSNGFNSSTYDYEVKNRFTAKLKNSTTVVKLDHVGNEVTYGYIEAWIVEFK